MLLFAFHTCRARKMTMQICCWPPISASTFFVCVCGFKLYNVTSAADEQIKKNRNGYIFKCMKNPTKMDY